MKHQFALYYQQTSTLSAGSSFLIIDKEFIHRLTNILRARVGDNYILFNRTDHAAILIKAITKKEISIEVQSIAKNKVLQPQISFLLPILKKEALSETIYTLAEIGVNHIQLITTEKSRKWGGQKELDRLQRVIIAAAEQSKNFAFPEIHEPEALENILNSINSPVSFDKLRTSGKKRFSSARPELVEGCEQNMEIFCILADPDGHAAMDVIKDLADSNPGQLVLTVGPEGAFTDSEILRLKENKFHFMRLTPTILRARQAAALLSGIMRSL